MNGTDGTVQQRGAEGRLIVALDVPTHEEALRLVDALPNVSCFKVGLELLFGGGLFGLLERLRARSDAEAGVFVDLKLSGDIGNTVASLVRQGQRHGVRFLTLAETVPFAMTRNTLQTARQARGGSRDPALLAVPYLSSLDTRDLRAVGIDDDVDTYILRRGRRMIEAGCDGLIVSGTAIARCRDALGPDVPIVSPGIRPAWAAQGDHKRAATPAEAVRWGADYLVVGRPVRDAPVPRDAAQRIIDEIAAALAATPPSP